jgi:benzoylformate decarboxylase
VTDSVRDATFDVMRRHGMTTIFGNPGSTEIAFLAGLPGDLRFVLALHEGAVVGIATGHALATGEPAFVNLHTAAGLGNAVAAIANARDLRAPLVVVTGQQDRRHSALAPFLTGRSLESLAGDYPVWRGVPARPQDVPGTIARAWHEARTRRGPALVVVPMDDWHADAGDTRAAAGAPARLLNAPLVDAGALAELADLIDAATAPALVAGAGADDAAGWAATVALAERLCCPVFQEPFGARAGFPQDHPLFAGHLHHGRRRLRETLDAHDLVVAVGTGAFRLYLFEPGPLVGPGTRIAVVTDDPEEAHRSPADLALLAPPAAACAALAQRVARRDASPPPPLSRPPAPAPPADGEPLRAGHVLQALADRLPADAVLVEETPSSRPELHQRIAARAPLGFVSAANGALGFGLAGAIGLRMGLPRRPVVAVVGDGSAMYSIQALWSAAHYGVGALFVVMANGAYAVMDALAAGHGAPGPWPALDGAGVADMARALGCPAVRVARHVELEAALDDAIPGLAGRREPLLVEVAVAR